MTEFLKYPETFSFANLNTICGQGMLERERYLLKTALRFLSHDAARRLRHAFKVLSLIKLTYVVDELEAAMRTTTDLHEFGFNSAVLGLMEQARQCRAKDNFYVGSSLRELWVPRPGSIKYSFWSKRFGNYNSQLAQTAGKTYFTFDRGVGVRISGLDVFTRQLGNEETVVGMRLHWTDGTEDLAGSSNDERTKQSSSSPSSSLSPAGVPAIRGAVGPIRSHKIRLDGFEGVQPRVSADEFIRRILFLSSVEIDRTVGGGPQIKYPTMEGRKSWGPFGNVSRNNDSNNNNVRSPKQVLETIPSNGKHVSERLFLDGLKGATVYKDDSGSDPILTSVKFKMSLLADRPLEGLTKTPPEDPIMNKEFLYKDCRLMLVTKLKKAVAFSNSMKKEEDT